MSKVLTEARRRLTLIKTERGAADPMLVLGSIAVLLVLLLGGAFAVVGFINSSHDTNAQSDLDKVSVAETAYFTQNTAFIPYDSKADVTIPAQKNLLDLETKAAIGFSPAAEGHLVVNPQGTGWVAISRSASQAKTFYIRTSVTPDISVVDATGTLVDTPTDTKKHNAYLKVQADLTTLGATAAIVKPWVTAATS